MLGERVIHKRLLIAAVGVVVSLAVAVYGASWVYAGVLSLYQGIASKRWPQVEGQVVTSTAIKQLHLLSFGPGHYDYYPEVKYWYVVNRTMYVSEKVLARDNPRESGQLYTQRMLKEYPPGSRVAVFYDPGKPQSAVLKPGADASGYVMVVLGVVLIAAGAIPVFVVLRTI